MLGTVLVIATLDTKWVEAGFLKGCIEKVGIGVLLMDAGIRGTSPIPADITRFTVAEAAGTILSHVQGIKGEGEALRIMTQGASELVRVLYHEGRIQGILGLGGSMGTTLGTGVMRSLPVGFPKVMISTMASRNTRPFVGTKDIMMLHSVCDLSGLNRITRKVLWN